MRRIFERKIQMELKVKMDSESRAHPACPYCNKMLEKMPSRKIKCRSCGKEIYVRSTQKIFESSILMREDAIALDQLKQMEAYGVTPGDFLNKRAQLSEKFGNRAKSADVIWGIFNDLISKNSQNLDALRMIYYSMALFLNLEGKDYSELLRQSAKMRLLDFKKEGIVKKVEISVGGEGLCNACCKLDGKVFLIDEALGKMTLPFKGCTNCIESGKQGFCMCDYMPVLD